MPLLIKKSLLVLFLLFLLRVDSVAAQGSVVPCGTTTCTIFKTIPEKLELLDRDSSGSRFKNAAALKNLAKSQGKDLLFATNAGIFSWTFAPLGLFIRNNQTIVPLNSGNGLGNFYLKPNGVFYIARKTAHVVESSKFTPATDIRIASQSGPLLLINNKIHPKFRLGSTNRTIRSGVGVGEGSVIYFAISNGPINFHDFAILFRDHLSCENALYLDGLISQMYLPELNLNQIGGNFAALFAVFADRQDKE